ncbi:MAG: glycoside hydrolase family 38 C-terminal domain-containing protein [Anaerolineaceae bacterium]
MQYLHIVSHTHWDREWYRTFQQFRLKLIHLVDNLLTILDSDPSYQYFMLDGQTIVLEDYLQMRMVNFPRLQNYIQENRILIGPWYILPDEFLVSPEATVRNLLIGKQICELFGQRMMVGYIPDPFGHISQMPQILTGFHIDTACLWRGVKQDAPTLLRWQAPDGSQVLLAHLYTSYSNADKWPAADPDQSILDLDAAADALQPHNPISHYLLMRGSDHLEPRPELPEHIRYYNQNSGSREAIHSTLPAYLAAATAELEEKQVSLPTIIGELRDPRKAHMLPGVLSARMWIKQRNHTSQTLLERWVEPFATWAELHSRGKEAFTQTVSFEKTNRINDPASLIHHAWKLLITNHPHDSICGCSIDQVHAEMAARFDQVEQIGEELTIQSLQALTSSVNTTSNNKTQPGAFAAVTVFNAAPFAQSGPAEIAVDLPADSAVLRMLNQQGEEVPCEILGQERQFIESNTYPIQALTALLTAAASEGHKARTLVNAHLTSENGLPCIEADFSSVLEPDLEALSEALGEIMNLISNSDPDTIIKVKVFNAPTMLVRFIANDVPAFGLDTYWVAAGSAGEFATPQVDHRSQDSTTIQNECFSVELDQTKGTLTLLDKRDSSSYPGLNSFIDVGDRGDEYNFCPPEHDQVCAPQVTGVQSYRTVLEEKMIIQYNLVLPKSLTEKRDSRSAETISCPLTTTLILQKGNPCLDFQVDFENHALDHRLEVRFPTGLNVATARYDGHFDVVERPIDLPEADAGWQEQPRPEVPQRAFADVSNANRGMMLANYGLPEVATLRGEDGNAQICLTLLRCIGWLSRDDMWTRQGQAGPPLPTPGAQELGQYHYAYRLIPHNGHWLPASKLAHTFQTPLRANLTTLHAGALTSRASMLAVEPESFLVTAIKPSLNEEGWIMRGVNLADTPIRLKVTPHLPVTAAALVNLDESLIAEMPLKPDQPLQLEVPSRRIVSLFFKIVD